jgi:hypothetical protein
LPFFNEGLEGGGEIGANDDLELLNVPSLLADHGVDHVGQLVEEWVLKRYLVERVGFQSQRHKLGIWVRRHSNILISLGFKVEVRYYLIEHHLIGLQEFHLNLVDLLPFPRIH